MTVQVDDDIALLEQMISDQAAADPIYHTTNYWRTKCADLLGYLRENGLKDFRRIRVRKGTPAAVLGSFGALDVTSPLPPGEIMAAVRRHSGNSGAVPVERLPASEVGNPERFEAGGVLYTQSWLNFYLRYVYVSRFMKLDGAVIAEIGPGSGKQAHLLKMAHPDATLILFDIPPQLYVTNQYLAKAFEGQDVVASYRETQAYRSAADFTPGKIHILGNWQIPLLKDLVFDLMWNAASFQEMEPEVVGHYLRFCEGARNIYLMQVMRGQSVASAPGQPGVIAPTTLATYKSALPDYTLKDHFFAPLAMPVHPVVWQYSETFWSRQ